MKIEKLRWTVRELQRAYEHDLLLGVDLAAVVLLVRERNAWHGTWVRHFLESATMYTDVIGAQLGAEEQRQRGNVFSIWEIPAVVFRGGSSVIALTDAHPDNPFGKYIGAGARRHETRLGPYLTGMYPGVSVRDAVRTFRHDSGFWRGPQPNEHSLRCGRLDDTAALNPLSCSPFAARSVGRGSKYHLGWDSVPTPYVAHGANAVAERWGAMLDEAGLPRDPSQDELRTYAATRLGARPHSLWRANKASLVRDVEARLRQVELGWAQVSEVCDDLKDEIRSVETELADARQAQLRPAGASHGVRAQRRRVEEARERLEELRLSAERAGAAASAAESKWLELTREAESIRKVR